MERQIRHPGGDGHHRARPGRTVQRAGGEIPARGPARIRPMTTTATGLRPPRPGGHRGAALESDGRAGAARAAAAGHRRLRHAPHAPGAPGRGAAQPLRAAHAGGDPHLRRNAARGLRLRLHRLVLPRGPGTGGQAHRPRPRSCRIPVITAAQAIRSALRQPGLPVHRAGLALPRRPRRGRLPLLGGGGHPRRRPAARGSGAHRHAPHLRTDQRRRAGGAAADRPGRRRLPGRQRHGHADPAGPAAAAHGTAAAGALLEPVPRLGTDADGGAGTGTAQPRTDCSQR